MNLLRKSQIFIICISLSGCSVEHTTSSGFLGWKKEPELGYKWSNPDSYFNYDVVWISGLRVDFLPNMATHSTEGEWIADDGYLLRKNELSAIGLAAFWKPGTRHTKFPNIHAGEKEKYWAADEGYRFLSNASLEVEPIPAPIESASTSGVSDGTAAAVGIGAAVICAIWDSCRDAAVEVGKEAAKDAIVDSIVN